MLGGLLSFESPCKTRARAEHLKKPVFSLTETSCNTIRDVLRSYIKTESLSVFVQRDKSDLEAWTTSLTCSVCMRFIIAMLLWVRLRIVLYQMSQVFFEHSVKTSLPTGDRQPLIKTACVSMGRVLSCLSN